MGDGITQQTEQKEANAAQEEAKRPEEITNNKDNSGSSFQAKFSKHEAELSHLNQMLEYERTAKIGIMHEFLRRIQDKIMTPENFATLYPDLAAGRIDIPRSYILREESKRSIADILSDKVNIKKQDKFVVLFSGPISSGKTNTKDHVQEHYHYILELVLHTLYMQELDKIREVGLDDEKQEIMYARRRLFHSLLNEKVDFKHEAPGNIDFILDAIEDRFNYGFYEQEKQDMHLVAQLLAFVKKPVLHTYKEITDTLPHLKIFYKDPKNYAEPVQHYTCQGRLEIHNEISLLDGLFQLDRDIWEDYSVFVKLQKLNKHWAPLAENNYLQRLRLVLKKADGTPAIHVPDVIALFVAHDTKTRYFRTKGRGGPELEAVTTDDIEKDDLYNYMLNEGELYRQFTQTLSSGNLNVPYIPKLDPSSVVHINADDDISARPELRSETLAMIITHAALHQQKLINTTQ